MELNKMAEEGEQFPENQGYLYEHKYESFQIQSFFKCGCPVNLSFYFELSSLCWCLLLGGKKNDSPVWTDIIQEIISSL